MVISHVLCSGACSPVDPSTRVLTPGIAATNAAAVATEIAEKKRRIRSTYLLHDRSVIPEGTEIVLNLHSWIDSETAAVVDAWVAEDERRRKAVWVNDRERPLRWSAGSAIDETFTPTGLAKPVIREASGQKREAIPGADVWRWKGQSLAELAIQEESSPGETQQS